MEKKYLDLIVCFKKLDEEDKREEITNNLNELLEFYHNYNKNMDESNTLLPILKKYENESEYLDVLFSYIISLKEEIAKYIDKKI